MDTNFIIYELNIFKLKVTRFYLSHTTLEVNVILFEIKIFCIHQNKMIEKISKFYFYLWW